MAFQFEQGSGREGADGGRTELKTSVPDGRLPGVIEPNPKADLLYYLQDAREALAWKLDGLSEYDVRRP